MKYLRKYLSNTSKPKGLGWSRYFLRIGVMQSHRGIAISQKVCTWYFGRGVGLLTGWYSYGPQCEIFRNQEESYLYSVKYLGGGGVEKIKISPPSFPISRVSSVFQLSLWKSSGYCANKGHSVIVEYSDIDWVIELEILVIGGPLYATMFLLEEISYRGIVRKQSVIKSSARAENCVVWVTQHVNICGWNTFKN